MRPWDNWEDWRAGLYQTLHTIEHVNDSATLLCDPDAFYETALEMVREWPHSSVHNLVHMWSGRNAWLGQASCCYAHGAPGGATREAWGQMTNTEQNAANTAARSVRDHYERQRNGQTLFAI